MGGTLSVSASGLRSAKGREGPFRLVIESVFDLVTRTGSGTRNPPQWRAAALLAVTGFTAGARRIALGALADRIHERAPAQLIALLSFSSVGFLLLIGGSSPP
jgi:hypothetical protein